MKFNYQGKQIKVEGTLDVGEGFYVECAQWPDGTYLTDEECQDVELVLQEKLYDHAYQNMVAAAEARAEAMEDR